MSSYITQQNSNAGLSFAANTDPPRSLVTPTSTPRKPRNTNVNGTLSTYDALEIWEYTVLLFHNNDWSEAILYTQRLLRRSQHTPGINRAALWANMGLFRFHLGEYYLALEAFELAMEAAGFVPSSAESHHTYPFTANETGQVGNCLGKGEIIRPVAYREHPEAAIYPFLAGCAAYQLDRSASTSFFHAAQLHFRTSLALFPRPRPPSPDCFSPDRTPHPEDQKIDLAPYGLLWSLERVRVIWNERICGVEAEFEEGRGELVAGRHWGINRMPAGLCFEPPPPQLLRMGARGGGGSTGGMLYVGGA